ncbi:MAG: cysteine desulfurase family protein [Nitrospinales bacterium]
MERIYLDHNATTPPHPEVLEAMLPVLKECFGNPSSIHSYGRAARVRVDEAREQVAELIHARPGEIVFTSGGTESDNFAILGTALALKEKGRHVITCRTEHPAVLNSCEQLQRLGFSVDYLPVDRQGRVDLDLLKQTLTPQTVLITIQHANSEVGALQDIEQIGELARGRGILFHTDAVQSVGKIPVDVTAMPVDMLSMSAHKLYGPKGVGALYLRKGVPSLFPLISGGGQEKKRRGGTENVAGIVGFGKASQIAGQRLGLTTIEDMRDRLDRLIRENIPSVERLGCPRHALPNTLNLAFEGADGESMMIALDMEGIAVSTGTACSSGSPMPSHTLAAMQTPADQINASLRFSLGWSNSPEQMDAVCSILTKVVRRIREKTPAVM